MAAAQEARYIKDSNTHYDVIVVGSGITGGWAAKEFTERGFRVLMLERGPKLEHRKDYSGENQPPWQVENRNQVSLADREAWPVQSLCYAFKPGSKQFFGNDKDLPYSTAEGTRFSWIRANQMGGKSLLWARQSFRLSDFDFEANLKDGHGGDWPIRYADLAPWYSHVERHAGISGSYENLPQVPDSDFLPPFEMYQAEKDVKAIIEREFPDRKLIIGRTANLSKPTEAHLAQGRGQCMARTECHLGCSFGAYFSTQSSTLPAAAATGLLEIAPDSVVHSLIHDDTRGRVHGVRVIDNETLAEREYFGRLVFLCASTLGSTQVLLNSRSAQFPNGYANSSGVLGHYLMDHNYNARANARLNGYAEEYYRGRRPTGIYIPNFHYEPSRYRSHYKRGYSLGGGAWRDDWRSMGWQDGFGPEFKQRMTGVGRWGFNFYAQGEMLPRFENEVSLHPTLKDKWGIPQLHFNVRWSDNERLMMEDAAAEMEKMMRAAGMEDIRPEVNDKAPGLAIHELGTARMGRDPKQSVLNGWNQAHDVPNLFVTDGASFCSTATQNPSLTMMALTARAVDYAAGEMKAQRI